MTEAVSGFAVSSMRVMKCKPWMRNELTEYLFTSDMVTYKENRLHWPWDVLIKYCSCPALVVIHCLAAEAQCYNAWEHKKSRTWRLSVNCTSCFEQAQPLRR